MVLLVSGDWTLQYGSSDGPRLDMGEHGRSTKSRLQKQVPDMSADKKGSSKKDHRRVVCRNKKARFQYEIVDTIEAGISLLGTEVKSVRGGGGSILEAFVKFENGEAWLVNAHIPPYEQAGSHFNHESRRKRKLLLKGKEIDKWSRKVQEKGLTVVPLQMYFLGAWVKIELGVGRGKKLHDKRAAMKERTDKREAERAMRRTD